MTNKKIEPPYNGVIYYKDGGTLDVRVYSRGHMDEIYQYVGELITVSHVWFEDFDGPGYDWDKSAKCWQRRLF